MPDRKAPKNRFDAVANASGHDLQTVLEVVAALKPYLKRVPGAKAGRTANGTPGKLRRFDLARMAQCEPPKPDFLIDSIAARGEVTVLWGAPGLGKSLLLEACARGVAYGEPVAGLVCKAGRVLYLDAENGEYEVHRRVRSLGLPPESVAIYDASAAVHIVEDYDDIAGVVEAEKPDLVVIDSLRRLTPGSEENDSGTMAEAIGAAKTLAQRFDCAVIVVHHARKDGLNYRGSSAIRDQVSISWHMGRADGDLDRTRRFLRCDKMRIGPEPDDRWLHIAHDADAGTVAVVTGDAAGPGGGITSGMRRASVADEVLTLLEDGPLSRPKIAEALGRNPKDGTVRRAVEELAELGRIKQQNKAWSLVPPDLTGAMENGTPTADDRVPPPKSEGVENGTPGKGARQGASGDLVAPSKAARNASIRGTGDGDVRVGGATRSASSGRQGTAR